MCIRLSFQRIAFFILFSASTIIVSWLVVGLAGIVAVLAIASWWAGKMIKWQES
jgi:hypothetical protein